MGSEREKRNKAESLLNEFKKDYAAIKGLDCGTPMSYCGAQGHVMCPAEEADANAGAAAEPEPRPAEPRPAVATGRGASQILEKIMPKECSESLKPLIQHWIFASWLGSRAWGLRGLK